LSARRIGGSNHNNHANTAIKDAMHFAIGNITVLL
jgi:hypothetical protein